MVDKTPPDNPITATIKNAQAPKVVDIRGRSKTKQATPTNTVESVEWESADGNYQIINGAFYQLKPTREGDTIKIKLGNFNCWIEEETIHDDGIIDKAFYRIKGKREDGTPLPIIEVTLVKFGVMNWPGELWGSRALIYSGTTKRDNLRVAILLYSNRNGDIARRTVYGYLGWKKIDNYWCYLTGSGAITAAGLDQNIQVDLGGGHMSRYCLPEPPELAQLQSELTAIDDLLAIAPNRPEIGVMLLLAIARAPLSECHPIDFVIYLQGSTGVFKSSVTALALAFFGEFDARRFPANFSDSESDLEGKAHQTKDSVFIVDDYKPAVNQVEATKLKAKTERYIRNTGNQAGRGRRNPDMTTKPAPYNRSLTLMTGENALNCGQSIDARTLNIEIRPHDVNTQRLAQLQKAAKDGVLRRIMAAYLQWLAPRIDGLKQTLPQEIIEWRDITIRHPSINSHNRAPEMFANLIAGASVFLEFLHDSHLIDEPAKEQRLDAIEQALILTFKAQSDYQQDQDEVERFADLLRSVLTSGGGHISAVENQAPPSIRPFVFGWMKNQETGEYRANGDPFGWHWHKDGKNGQIWLDKNTAYKLISEFARKTGEPFLMSSSTLWRRLDDRGLLLATEKSKDNTGKLDVKRTIAGYSKRVLVISESWLLPTPEIESKPNAEKS